MGGLILIVLVKLIQRVIPADTLGGPILIAQMAGHQASKGLVDYLLLMAGISVNLGVINLLPIPVLDGGHLVFLGIEAVRRKPLGQRTMLLAQKVGLALLLTLIAFVMYNDVLRIITGKSLPW
jgi:regulator of sigma E protease